ncbi:uncharacterized protein BCR38DRAFT_411364 [Pseudomassariella vexata]|uniref:Uncharacterized protein n=1 Tax=Pseudomassariella vexata TaxID=1141098 RepID=A0A1Y2DQB9_9PEZI|nr:uncharacterized protein BCR38DRAFT_411364 [Pseudomassariella vexata]ORY61492.1 hypothetical protein BCR38DRAFT_411364 [Pseudomassariella vexata]
MCVSIQITVQLDEILRYTTLLFYHLPLIPLLVCSCISSVRPFRNNDEVDGRSAGNTSRTPRPAGVESPKDRGVNTFVMMAGHHASRSCRTHHATTCLQVSRQHVASNDRSFQRFNQQGAVVRFSGHDGWNPNSHGRHFMQAAQFGIHTPAVKEFTSHTQASRSPTCGKRARREIAVAIDHM